MFVCVLAATWNHVCGRQVQHFCKVMSREWQALHFASLYTDFVAGTEVSPDQVQVSWQTYSAAQGQLDFVVGAALLQGKGQQRKRSQPKRYQVETVSYPSMCHESHVTWAKRRHFPAPNSRRHAGFQHCLRLEQCARGCRLTAGLVAGGGLVKDDRRTERQTMYWLIDVTDWLDNWV